MHTSSVALPIHPDFVSDSRAATTPFACAYIHRRGISIGVNKYLGYGVGYGVLISFVQE